MVVRNIRHGREVFKRLAVNPWIVIDTETEPKHPYTDGNAAITWGRMQITIFSVCYRGESYCFPTNNFSPKYPTPRQWWGLLRPLVVSERITKVMANAIYDWTVFDVIEQVNWPRLWCTMIGAWMANPAYAKGLKARAALYGRFLQEARSSKKAQGVDWTNEAEVAAYSEQDVIIADEMFQMQKFGFVIRPKRVPVLSVTGRIDYEDNPLPKTGKIVIEHESNRRFDTDWAQLIELPVLRATIRAQRTGFPMDLRYLRKIKNQMDVDLETLLKRIYQAAGKKINLDSTDDLEWLFDKLKIHNPHKTPKGKMARGKNIIAKLIGQHPIMQDIANRKKIGTLISFYFGAVNKKGEEKEAGLEHYTGPDGRIHTMNSTIGSVTGRGTQGRPNLLQTPSRADIYQIKKAFVAPGRETQ